MPRPPRTLPPLILLASDREPSASDVERVLSSHGYTVFRAHTGRIALEAAKSAQPKLVLIDVMLPETDPLGLCRSLRDDPELGPSVPLLVITTAQPAPADHRVALRAGVWEFLVDPIHADELRGKVDSYVLATMQGAKPAPAPLTDDTGLYTAAALGRRARELALQAFHHYAGFACVVLSPAHERDVPRVAAGLKVAGRRSDAIGRLGPADFAIVAPGTDGQGAVLLAERLAREIRAQGDGGSALELRAGYDAVPNIRRAPLEPGSMLDRASQALAKARGAARGEWIRAYEGESGAAAGGGLTARR